MKRHGNEMRTHLICCLAGFWVFELLSIPNASVTHFDLWLIFHSHSNGPFVCSAWVPNYFWEEEGESPCELCRSANKVLVSACSERFISSECFSEKTNIFVAIDLFFFRQSMLQHAANDNNMHYHHWKLLNVAEDSILITSFMHIKYSD